MKLHVVILYIILLNLLSSCNFNITDMPGPQISSTIESAKKHGSFICGFKVNENKINGSPVNSIFAEKKYWLSEGFWGHFEVNCCESQIVIVYDVSHNAVKGNDVPEYWKYINNLVVTRYYKGTVFPDSITIKVIPDINKPDSFGNFTLYKIKE